MTDQVDPAARQVPASVAQHDHEDDLARVDGVPGSAALGSTAATSKGVSVTTEKTNPTKADPPPDAHELQCVVQVLDANGIETEMAPGVPYTVHGRVQAAIDGAGAGQSSTYQLAERIVRYFRDSTVQAKVGHGHLIEGEVIAHVAEMLKGAR